MTGAAPVPRFSFSFPFSGARAGLPLALAAGLALSAGACTTPAAKKTAAADRQVEAKAQAKNGAKNGARNGRAEGKPLSWWQRMTRSREGGEKPWVYGDMRPGKGLLSDDEDGFVLMRKGEAGSSDPAKPSKVRR